MVVPAASRSEAIRRIALTRLLGEWRERHSINAAAESVKMCRCVGRTSFSMMVRSASWIAPSSPPLTDMPPGNVSAMVIPRRGITTAAEQIGLGKETKAASVYTASFSLVFVHSWTSLQCCRTWQACLSGRLGPAPLGTGRSSTTHTSSLHGGSTSGRGGRALISEPIISRICRPEAECWSRSR